MTTTKPITLKCPNCQNTTVTPYNKELFEDDETMIQCPTCSANALVLYWR
jgi:ribosomal protein S27E